MAPGKRLLPDPRDPFRAAPRAFGTVRMRHGIGEDQCGGKKGGWILLGAAETQGMARCDRATRNGAAPVFRSE